MSKKEQKAKQSVKELQQQIDHLTEQVMRERADSENIRRRHEEQLSGLKTLIKAQVVADLLPVVDNFERSIKHLPKDLEGHDYVKGIQGVVKQFDTALQDLGVRKIKTVGEEFNPELHEAVSMEEGKGEAEIVVEELQAGYRLNDEVIRHAMVKVTHAEPRKENKK
jgi:molecular chaperone GrpE